MDLTQKHCQPCEGGMPPLTEEEAKELLKQIQGWELVEGKKIRKVFEFKNFKQAMEFVNTVAAIAEQEGHHPDIHISWNKVTLELWTHAIKGLSENDFIVAAKVEKIRT